MIIPSPFEPGAQALPLQEHDEFIPDLSRFSGQVRVWSSSSLREVVVALYDNMGGLE